MSPHAVSLRRIENSPRWWIWCSGKRMPNREHGVCLHTSGCSCDCFSCSGFVKSQCGRIGYLAAGSAWRAAAAWRQDPHRKNCARCPALPGTPVQSLADFSLSVEVKCKHRDLSPSHVDHRAALQAQSSDLLPCKRRCLTANATTAPAAACEWPAAAPRPPPPRSWRPSARRPAHQGAPPPAATGRACRPALHDKGSLSENSSAPHGKAARPRTTACCHRTGVSLGAARQRQSVEKFAQLSPSWKASTSRRTTACCHGTGVSPAPAPACPRHSKMFVSPNVCPNAWTQHKQSRPARPGAPPPASTGPAFPPALQMQRLER